MSVWRIVALYAILLAFSTSIQNVALRIAMCRLDRLAEDLRWGVVPRSWCVLDLAGADYRACDWCSDT